MAYKNTRYTSEISIYIPEQYNHIMYTECKNKYENVYKLKGLDNVIIGSYKPTIYYELYNALNLSQTYENIYNISLNHSVVIPSYLPFTEYVKF